VKASPMARLQQKTQAAVTTGSAGSTGIPCAMVLTAYLRALPGVPGLIATVARGSSSAGLIPASGDQDHAISPSAPAALVSRRRSVHRIPLPRFVTIAIRPSVGAGCAETTIKFGKMEVKFSRLVDWMMRCG